MLPLQARQPRPVVVLRERRAGRLGQRQVVGGVPVAHGGRLAARRQPLLGVLAQRLQQPEAGGAVGRLVRHHQRLVHQAGEPVEHVRRRDAVAVGADRLRRLQRPPPGEDRQPGEERPLRLGQQGVAPLHRRAQRLLPREGVAPAAGQQPEAVLQPGQQLLRAAAPAPGRRPARGPGAARPAGRRPPPPPRRSRR